jgi:hypothetical protein
MAAIVPHCPNRGAGVADLLRADQTLSELDGRESKTAQLGATTTL